MYYAYCPGHDAQLLYSVTSIECVHNTPIGIEVVLRCSCGSRVEVLSGRTA